ncbi:UNVERIFIED_CONTAM: hypothetical protein HDU68_009967 [Siphonaria sp. JEL0065]|nr:hypothetical protein HDU68_009967 [Siphonaria sp. JEL0065]
MIRSQATEDNFEAGPSSPPPTGKRRMSHSSSVGSDFDDDNVNVFFGSASATTEIVTEPLVASVALAQRIFAAPSSASASVTGKGAVRSSEGRGVSSSVRDEETRADETTLANGASVADETPFATLRRLLFETRSLVAELVDSGPSSNPAANHATTHSLRVTAKKVDAALAQLANQSNSSNPKESSLAIAENTNALRAHIEHAKLGRAVAAKPRSYAGAVSSYASAVVSPITSPRLNPTAIPFIPSPIHHQQQVQAPPQLQQVQQQYPPLPATSSSIQYDLYYQPPTSSSSSTTATNNIIFADDILDIERRIASLERLVGNTASSSSSSNSVTTTSILDDIQDLDSTLTLLTTPHALARLSRRIQTISGQIDRTVRLRRRIIAQQQKQRRRVTGGGDSSFSDYSDDDEDEVDDDEHDLDPNNTNQPKESAVNQLIEHEMESRRAEDERRAGYLFNALSDRLDPLSSTIPSLLARLKGLKILNSEISGTTVRETMNEVENEQNGLILQKFDKVRNGMGRIRVQMRQGAKEGARRFEEIEKQVSELVVAIEARFGGEHQRGLKRTSVPPAVPPRPYSSSSTTGGVSFADVDSNKVDGGVDANSLSGEGNAFEVYSKPSFLDNQEAPKPESHW